MTEYAPSSEVMAVWPNISGNEINRRGQSSKLRPHPIFWRNDHDTFPQRFSNRPGFSWIVPDNSLNQKVIAIYFWLVT